MNVKLIFRPGFGVKSQNIRGRRYMGASHALEFSDEKTSQYLNFRGYIELHGWKGI